MKIEFKREKNLEWKPGDIVKVKWDNSPNKSGEHFFFVAMENAFIDLQRGGIFYYELGDYTMVYTGKKHMEILEVFKNKEITLMLG